MDNNTSPYISIVVPVYNGARTLPDLFSRTHAIMEKHGLTFEMLLVDDGSKDNSWQKIVELKKEYGKIIRGYKLSHNQGQQSATLCGLLFAKGLWTITIDDDLQTPPEEIPVLLEAAIRTNADIVYGVYPILHHSFIHNIGTRIFRSILRLVAPHFPDGSSFRLVKAEILKGIPRDHGPGIFIDPMLSWQTSAVATVNVKHNRRPHQKSGYSFLKLIKLALTLLMVYSTLPLRLMIWFGLLAAIISFGVGIYFFIQKITVGASVGFSALIVTIAFAAGIILLSLGVLGEYISRIYTMGAGRPSFTVKTII
jgi:polyisoprenyl-phosphate glycosyltransferase